MSLSLRMQTSVCCQTTSNPNVVSAQVFCIDASVITTDSLETVSASAILIAFNTAGGGQSVSTMIGPCDQMFGSKGPSCTVSFVISFTVPLTGNTIIVTTAVVTMCSASANGTDSLTPTCSRSVCVTMSCGDGSFNLDVAEDFSVTLNSQTQPKFPFSMPCVPVLPRHSRLTVSVPSLKTAKLCNFVIEFTGQVLASVACSSSERLAITRREQLVRQLHDDRIYLATAPESPFMWLGFYIAATCDRVDGTGGLNAHLTQSSLPLLSRSVLSLKRACTNSRLSGRFREEQAFAQVGTDGGTRLQRSLLRAFGVECNGCRQLGVDRGQRNLQGMFVATLQAKIGIVTGVVSGIPSIPFVSSVKLERCVNREFRTADVHANGSS